MVKLKNVHGVIQFIQQTWLKPYINMKREEKIQEMNLKKIYLS